MLHAIIVIAQYARDQGVAGARDQALSYSVPHEESELMLGMYDVTSIATIQII